MRSRVQWCAVLLLCVIPGRAVMPQRPIAGACDGIVWAPPETLRTAEGRAVFVEHPQIVAAGGDNLLIGSWGAEVDSLPRALTAGYIVGTNGAARSIRMPVDQPAWGPPRTARGRDGETIALWIPDDSAHAGDRRRLRVAELRAGEWGPVSFIELPARAAWSLVSASALVSSGGELFLVVPTPLGEEDGAILVRRTADRWRATGLPIERIGYARLAPAGGDTLVVAYVAAGPRGNTLFVRRLTTHGDTIGTRIQVSEHGAGPVHDPELVVADDSLLFLAWGVEERSGGIRRLSLATSRDGGRTWRRRSDTIVDGGFDLLWSVADPRGRLHVVVRGEQDGEPRPVHLLWSGTAWHASPVPPAAGVFSAGHPFLLFDATGAPRLIWGAAGFADTIFAAPVSLISTGRDGCAGLDALDASAMARSGAHPIRDRIISRRVGSPTWLPVGLGTHFSVRGAASPRAGRQHEQRGSNAFISDHQPGAGARRAGAREPRVRGPPSRAARAPC